MVTIFERDTAIRRPTLRL